MRLLSLPDEQMVKLQLLPVMDGTVWIDNMKEEPRLVFQFDKHARSAEWNSVGFFAASDVGGWVGIISAWGDCV